MATAQILGKQPFAVLLCNFSDSVNPKPFTYDDAQVGWETNRLFWETTSYGKVSLEGSVVNDWITLPITNSNFQATYTSRTTMIQYAKDQSGIDQSKFVGFIVIFSEPVGTAWTQGNGAIFEPTICYSTTICHEMTHILGEPTHSFDFSNRIDGDGNPPGMYWDQTDIMSAQNCWRTQRIASDDFSGRGPHHCMIWKDEFGWLSDSKVLRLSEQDLEGPIDGEWILEARDSPVTDQYICIFFRDLTIELTVPRGFDAGMPAAGIIIHQNIGGVPWVLVPDLGHQPDVKLWSAGSVYRKDADVDGRPVFYIWVVSIDESQGTALVNISNGPIAPLQAVQILAIRKKMGAHHDYIDAVGISNGAGALIAIERSIVVDYIVNGRNRFFVVGTDGSSANVEVDGHTIKTVPDGFLADNLLSLPSF
jgi:hypothetical protein